MQNTIFDLPQTTGSIHFFLEGCQYPGDSNRRIGRKNENDNPLRKRHMFFNRYINVCFFHGIRSFRVQIWTWRNWKNPAKRLFLCCFSQGNPGNKLEKW